MGSVLINRDNIDEVWENMRSGGKDMKGMAKTSKGEKTVGLYVPRLYYDVIRPHFPQPEGNRQLPSASLANHIAALHQEGHSTDPILGIQFR